MSLVKIGRGKIMLFLQAQMELRVLVYRETIWRSEIQERLGEVCTASRSTFLV
jgi:hypothetical protein